MAAPAHSTEPRAWLEGSGCLRDREAAALRGDAAAGSPTFPQQVGLLSGMKIHTPVPSHEGRICHCYRPTPVERGKTQPFSFHPWAQGEAGALRRLRWYPVTQLEE